MNISVHQSMLMKALTMVKDAVSPKSTLPVLGNVLIATDGDKLKVAATDLGVGITAWIPATVTEEGGITLPARLLTEFVSSLPAVAVGIEIDTRTMIAKLTAGKTKATIKGIDAAEFPIIGGTIDAEPVTLPAKDLRQMIDGTVFAAAVDQSRPTLTGIDTRIVTGRLQMAATDGYRLSVTSVKVDADDTSVIIPASNLRAFAKILDPKAMAEDAAARIMIDEASVRFDVAGPDWRAEVVSSTIGANFPDYRAIIPKSTYTTATVNVASMTNAVRTARLFARENSNIIRLRIQDGAVNILAQGAESGDSTHVIDAATTGELLEISFNADYLIAALSATDADELTLQFTHPNRPCKIEHGDWMHVIMPMTPPSKG